MDSTDAGSVLVGTSGWRYAGWRGDYYPSGLRQRDELAYLAGRMSSVEINGSFYSLQRPTSYQQWRAMVPDRFTFAVKGGRYITHLKRLRDVETPMANFFASGVLSLGPTLGPVLWQLPERVTFDAEVVRAFLDLLPRTTNAAAELASRHDDKVPTDRAVVTAEAEQPLRHALEFRHPSFMAPDATALLRDQGIATVVADTAGRWVQSWEVTSDLVYVRLHGDRELYTSGYEDAALDAWADRCSRWSATGHDVVVYFDNDAKGHAPYDAERLLDRLGRQRSERLGGSRAGTAPR